MKFISREINRSSRSTIGMLSAAASLAFAGPLMAQEGVGTSTSPVMVASSQTLTPGLHGLAVTAHHPVLFSGVLKSYGSNPGKFYGKNTKDGRTFRFRYALDEEKTYILEITSGELAGVIQEITEFTASTFSISDYLWSGGLKEYDSFTIREAQTLETLFPTRIYDPKGLKLGDSANEADVIYSFDNQSSSWNGFFQNHDGKWISAETQEEVRNRPVIHTDGMVLFAAQRPSGTPPLTLSTSGHLKVTPTQHYVSGLNFIGNPKPIQAEQTLQSSNLKHELTRGANAGPADLIYLYQGYQVFGFYFRLDGALVSLETGSVQSAPVKMPSAFFVVRKGDAKMITVFSDES